MSVALTLTRLGGCATWGQLRQVHSTRAIRCSLARGEMVRLARGRYAAPTVIAHRSAAHQRTAAASHLSAALLHGWPVKHPPTLAHLTVPRDRKVSREDQEQVQVHWAPVSEEERRAGVTSPLRTILDCARSLPWDEGLTVADSALRSGQVRAEELVAAARCLRGPGAGKALRVAQHADARAANPLESVVRAVLADIPGLDLTPQFTIAEPGVFAVADLADPALRLVIETEGYEHHGTRAGLRRDCRRHSGLAVFGWSVLRFSWEDVMLHPEWVVWVVSSWLAQRRGQLIGQPPRLHSPRAAA